MSSSTDTRVIFLVLLVVSFCISSSTLSPFALVRLFTRSSADRSQCLERFDGSGNSSGSETSFDILEKYIKFSIEEISKAGRIQSAKQRRFMAKR